MWNKILFLKNNRRAGAATAGAATGAAAGACAMTAPQVNKLNPRARLASSFFMSVFSMNVEAEAYSASLPVSPVRMRTTCSRL